MAGWEDGFQFELSEDERLCQEMARSFAQKEVLPHAARIDREHEFPKAIIAKAAELGMLGALTPEELGGSGFSNVAYALLIEELAAACASTSIIVSAHNSLCLAPILEYGTHQQKVQFARPLSAQGKIGCFSLSEPGSGSDAAALKTVARKTDTGWVIQGAKNWITNGPVASSVVLFASTDQSQGHRGVSAFVHSLDLPGITIGKPEEKLGICGSPTCAISYDDVELPDDALLGEVGGGFRVAMTTLNGGRIGVAAQAIGIARAALRDALAYAQQRQAFGKAIIKHQSIQNYIAEMICRIDASRNLTLGAAKRKDAGKDYIRHAAMAKLFSSETAMYCAERGVQIHGGYGYVKDYPAERHMRDAKITEIYEGTSEIQRLVIASRLLEE
jgi:butyryl-CoA dehydrogenase